MSPFWQPTDSPEFESPTFLKSGSYYLDFTLPINDYYQSVVVFFFLFGLGQSRRVKMDRTPITVGPGVDMPIMHDSDRYDFVRDIGSGNFGVARLMRDKHTKELVAVKYIERGDKVSFGNLIVKKICVCSYCSFSKFYLWKSGSGRSMIDIIGTIFFFFNYCLSVFFFF